MQALAPAFNGLLRNTGVRRVVVSALQWQSARRLQLELYWAAEYLSGFSGDINVPVLSLAARSVRH